MPDFWFDVDVALTEVPVNKVPLVGTDGLTIDAGVTYNEAGIDLNWNFVTTAGVYTQTNVVPTTAGNYDWAAQGNGMYTIEMTATGGASANNDTEGYGWFTGDTTATMPWAGPTIGFRAAALNNLLIDSAYSATRGLAGTALPAVAANGAGGLPVSAAGGLAMDTLADWVNAGRLDAILDTIAEDTTTDIPALITPIQAALDDTKLWSGTFTAANATTITMADEADANAIYVGARVGVVLTSGTNCNGRWYWGTVGASRVITVDPAFTADGAVAPTGTRVGAVYAAPKSPTISPPVVDAAAVITLLGAVDTAAATGVVTGTDNLMAYLKQLVTQNLNPAGPKKGEAIEDLSWPMVDGNGDVVTGETVAMTIQKDGGTPAALTGTIAEIGSTGNYQVTTSPAITTTEMDANHVYLVATSTNAKPQAMQFWPETRA